MFILIFNQLVKMLIILIVGIVCVRIGLVSKEGSKTISNLLLMLVNPILIIMVYQTDYDSILVKGLLFSFVAAFISHILAILVSKLLFRDKEDPNNMINQFAAVYSNCGFIGIPLINSVLGSEGVFYLTAYMTVFNVLTWTHGLSLTKGHFDPKLLKEGLTAPMVIGTFIAMILFFTQIHIPDTIAASMQYIADMNTPLAMMVAGFSVANSDIKKICTNVQIYRIALTKLIIVPLVVLLFLWIAPFNADIAYPTLIASACPTGTTITMMSIRFDKNAAYASEIFSFTTVLSIITIPLIIFIAGFLL